MTIVEINHFIPISGVCLCRYVAGRIAPIHAIVLAISFRMRRTFGAWAGCDCNVAAQNENDPPPLPCKLLSASAF